MIWCPGGWDAEGWFSVEFPLTVLSRESSVNTSGKRVGFEARLSLNPSHFPYQPYDLGRASGTPSAKVSLSVARGNNNIRWPHLAVRGITWINICKTFTQRPTNISYCYICIKLWNIIHKPLRTSYVSMWGQLEEEELFLKQMTPCGIMFVRVWGISSNSAS